MFELVSTGFGAELGIKLCHMKILLKVDLVKKVFSSQFIQMKVTASCSLFFVLFWRHITFKKLKVLIFFESD